MKRISVNLRFGLAVLFVVGVSFFFTTPAAAAIGKISGFTGDVVLTSGARIEQIKSPGVPLNDGDIIQTKQGEAQVLFNDGSVLRINPFSNSLLQEREEQSGTWLFKTTTAARRVTCLVGKIFFESGSSGKKNYLQTPTAVAGIRGSAADFGFDNRNSYLNVVSGEAAVTGTMIRGGFPNPGSEAARRSPVYQAQTRALSIKTETERVNTQTTSEGQKNVNTAAASVSTLNVSNEAAALLVKNPDTVVKDQAQLTTAVVKTSIAAVEASAAVGKIQIVAEQAT